MTKPTNEDKITRFMAFDDISEHEDNTHQITEMMDESMAAMVRDANLNARMDLLKNKPTNTSNADKKIELSSSEKDLQVINYAVNQHFPDLCIRFLEENSAGIAALGEFRLTEVKLLDRKRMVIKCEIKMSNQTKPSVGYIEYNFHTQKFYHVKYFTSGTIRRIYSIVIHPNSSKIATKFVDFMKSIIDAQTKYENQINNQSEIKPSKSR